MLNKHLPHKKGENDLMITFCGSGKCKCPSIHIDKHNDTIIIGGEEEGYTRFTKEEFKLFMDEMKDGTFDPFIQ